MFGECCVGFFDEMFDCVVVLVVVVVGVWFVDLDVVVVCFCVMWQYVECDDCVFLCVVCCVCDCILECVVIDDYVVGWYYGEYGIVCECVCVECGQCQCGCGVLCGRFQQDVGGC